MKTKLNIICVLIFVAMAGSVANYFHHNWGEISWNFMRGFKAGMNTSAKQFDAVPQGGLQSVSERQVHYLNLLPKDWTAFPDSVRDEVSGKWLPAKYQSVIVERNDKTLMGSNPWEMILGILSSFIFAGATLVQVTTFILLIVAINKSVIFAWSNVWKLRIMGYAMLVSFIIKVLYSYVAFQTEVKEISIPGYVLENKELWDFYLLIPGLGLLLMAEIFAIGLRLKEEQDLTI